MARAERVLPGGVSSPVRAYRAVGGSPLVFRRGEGAELEDVDGRRYIDFVNSWGPLILGHAHPEGRAAIIEATERGTTFGAPGEQEVELAETIVRWYPGLEQVRFVSSGTEATMSACRLARGFTRRDRIVKFSGCYHGHADHLLVAAGSGLVTFGEPSSAGVPRAFARETIVLPLDDQEAFASLVRARGREIAAVIIEPVPANNGLLVQTPEFLATLRVLEREDAWSRLEHAGDALERSLSPVLAESAIPANLVRMGSLFWLLLQDGAAPRAAERIDPAAAQRYAPLFHALLDRGIALAPSAYEVAFLSLAHTPAHLDALRDALAVALRAPAAVPA